MKTTILKLSVAAGLATVLGTAVLADEKREITLEGNGMCLRCELKQADSCQNAIQVNYFMEHNQVAKDFHGNICKGVKKIVATGKLKEANGKKIFVPSKLALGDTPVKAEGDEKVFVGEGLCGRCELGEASSCQNVVRVTFAMEPNQVAKDFHGNICTSVRKIKATGTVQDKNGKKILTASKIELDN